MPDDTVILTMPRYIAEELSKVLEAEAYRESDQGWGKMAELLVKSGSDGEITVRHGDDETVSRWLREVDW